MMARSLHAVVPDSIDDTRQPSGGNSYDRRILAGLERLDWAVTRHRIAVPLMTARPHDESCTEQVAAALDGLDDGSLVLVDGLVACAAPDSLLEASARLHLVVLVHMSFGAASGSARLIEAEARALAAARGIVATSAWGRDLLLDLYDVDQRRLAVVAPGVDRRAVVEGSPSGSRLLYVGTVAEHKGTDLLVDALAGLVNPGWRCTVVGPLDRDRDFVDSLLRRSQLLEVGERLRFVGPLAGPDLDQAFRDSDVLVVPSRFENYGMVIGEAFARSIPVVASSVGGLPEAVGTDDATGEPAGLLIAPGSPEALRSALERWLTDPTLRQELRDRAGRRRAGLASWEDAARALDTVLDGWATDPLASTE